MTYHFFQGQSATSMKSGHGISEIIGSDEKGSAEGENATHPLNGAALSREDVILVKGSPNFHYLLNEHHDSSSSSGLPSISAGGGSTGSSRGVGSGCSSSSAGSERMTGGSTR